MKRILVVEDEQVLADIIKSKLEEEGFEVDCLHHGVRAYEALDTDHGYDLVLLDLFLPEMEGFEILEKLREKQKLGMPVIIFSNFAEKSRIEQAHEFGIADYIVKVAFSPSEIVAKVKDVLALGKQSGGVNGYSSFGSIQDVMPMSEVLRPGEPSNNP